MDIKRENYEIWAIDYLEGNLTPSKTAELMAFLAENPDLAEELDNIRDSRRVPESQEPTSDLSFLKKKYEEISISPESFEEFCIAYHEGDLCLDTQKKLLDYIENDSSRQNLFRTYKRLKVKPDESIVFQQKRALKKQVLIQAVWNPKRILQLSSSIAAAIILFIVLNNKLVNTNTETNTLINTTQTSITNIKQDSTPKRINTKGVVMSIQKSVVPAKPAYLDEAPSQISQHLATEIIRTRLMSSLCSVVDTAELEDIFIPVSRIDIASIPTNYSESALSLVYSESEYHTTQKSKSIPRNAYNNVQHNTQLFLAKANNLSLDALLRKSVEGINQVVEADLQYNSETDDEGRIVAFALSSERFNIKRKMKSN